jgi:NAD+ kinase
VVKLVDTKDLKSLPFWECQFESGRGHHTKKMNIPLIISDKNKKSLNIKNKINRILTKQKINKANLVIVIGGDGFMLQTLKKNKNSKKSFYGINSGNYGFLMNKFSEKNLLKYILNAKSINIFPLEMTVNSQNKIRKSLAINEVSILRQSRQTATLSIKNNSKNIIKKLVSDGVLVSTPAGSTAYNLSVHGPILNLNSKKISIAPISAFRPRRWAGKIVSDKSKVIITNLDPKKRPVSAVADNFEVRNIKKVTVKVQNKIKFSLLYDKNSSLHKKIKLEQLRKEII